MTALRSGPGGTPSAPRERRVFLDGAPATAQVIDRDALTPGVPLAGPAIVEQYDTTVLVPAGFAVTLDPQGSLIGEATHGNG
jgi:N-methylhydantoinase A